jgi:hypothetical protein
MYRTCKCSRLQTEGKWKAVTNLKYFLQNRVVNELMERCEETKNK